MDPIFETQFSAGTQGIRVGDVEIEKLGERDGTVFVTCPRELASPEWTRRWDLEQQRRADYEAWGALLRTEMEKADAEAAANAEHARQMAEREAAVARALQEREEAEAAERAAAEAAAIEAAAKQEADAAAARAEEERRQAEEAERVATAEKKTRRGGR